MNFGERLRYERKRLGLTQSELAKKLGISRNTQVNYEAMSREPDVKYLGKLEELGVNTRYLISGEEAVVTEEELQRQSELIHQIVYEIEKSLILNPDIKISPLKKAGLVTVLFKLCYPTGFLDLNTLNELLMISKD